MHVKVTRGRAAVALYECDVVNIRKEGENTIFIPLRMQIDKEKGVAGLFSVVDIVIPRDGDIVYVENAAGGTIDTFRAGEDLPAGRGIEIQDRNGEGQPEPESDRSRVFRGLPRGSLPKENLDVVGGESGKASLPALQPPPVRRG